MRPLLRCCFNSSVCAVLRCAFGYESFALHPIWIATSKLTDLSSQAKVANPPVDLSVSAEPFGDLASFPSRTSGLRWSVMLRLTHLSAPLPPSTRDPSATSDISIAPKATLVGLGAGAQRPTTMASPPRESSPAPHARAVL
jgi:hypothetical protein